MPNWCGELKGEPDYLEQIETAYGRCREKWSMLSPIDWQLAAQWEKDGIPIFIVLAAIDDCCKKYKAKKDPGKINTLRYFDQAVRQHFAGWSRARVGASTATEPAEVHEQNEADAAIERCELIIARYGEAKKNATPALRDALTQVIDAVFQEILKIEGTGETEETDAALRNLGIWLEKALFRGNAGSRRSKGRHPQTLPSIRRNRRPRPTPHQRTLRPPQSTSTHPFRSMVKSAIMDPAWIGLLGTLLGGVLVGGISILTKRMELKHQERMEGMRVKLVKLEKIYDELGIFTNSLKDYLHAVEKQIATGDQDQIATTFIEQTREFADRLALTGFQINLHAPEMVPQFARCMARVTNVTQRFNNIIMDIAASGRRIHREEFAPFHDEIGAMLLLVGADTLQLQQGIADKIMDLTNEKKKNPQLTQSNQNKELLGGGNYDSGSGS